MSKIIIYDNKNFLIAELNGKVDKEKESTYIAKFSKYRLIHSISLKKQLRKIEKIFRYHKEKK